MTRAEVDEKGFHLLAPMLGKARARKLCDTVWDHREGEGRADAAPAAAGVVRR